MIRETIRPLSTPFSSIFRRHGALRRKLIAPPRPGSEPLMSRRADRELPPVVSSWRPWRTLPIFLAVITVSAFGIFNYQKASSSVVNATLYALRTSTKAREVLGDEIYFASKMPWIWGEMDQMHGKINISFAVKGTRSRGTMKFRTVRKTRKGYFETQEWSLTTEDGQVIQLLDEERSDPFKNTTLQSDILAQA